MGRIARTSARTTFGAIAAIFASPSYHGRAAGAPRRLGDASVFIDYHRSAMPRDPLLDGARFDAARFDGVALIEGDNLSVMQRLMSDPAVASQVALAYLDPPFGTGRSFGAYDDRWAGGRAELVEVLRPRLALVHALLAADGSILVHLDHRIAHVVAVLLDELFGAGDRDPRRTTPAPGFRSELIWTYGLGGSSSRVYPRKHDTILWYSKGSEWNFTAPRIPARSVRMRGQSKKQLDVMLGPPQLDCEASEARALSDVWDVAALNNMALERTGYPTQKPLALLERLIGAHSREGDLILDPCCGSGTTLVAAQRLKRRAIGIDASAEAIRVVTERLQGSSVLGT